MNYGEKDFKKRLQNIIDSHEWFGFGECPGCKTVFKHSVLDGDEGVKCPRCGQGVRGDLFPNPCKQYRMLFLEAIREAMRTKIDCIDDFRHPYMDAHTSYELFLRQIVTTRFLKAKLGDNIISLILYRIKRNNKDKDADKKLEQSFLTKVEKGKFRYRYLDEKTGEDRCFIDMNCYF